MSSTAAQTTEAVENNQIDWEAIFDELGNEYWESVSSSQLALMASMHADGVSDETEAGERMLDAVENGRLEKERSGYTIAGVEPPQPENTDTETSEKSSQTDQDGSEDAALESDVANERLQDAHDHVSGELADMQEQIESMHREVNVVLPILTKTMRNLFGDIPLEDMPTAALEFRDQLEEHQDVLRDIQDNMDELGDLNDGEQASTKTRVMQLRRYLTEQAEKNGQEYTGTYGMTDKEIVSFFDGEIGRSWASQLLDKVADGIDSEDVDSHPAFEKKTFSDSRPKQVRVDLDKMPEDSVYRLKNSGRSEGA